MATAPVPSLNIPVGGSAILRPTFLDQNSHAMQATLPVTFSSSDQTLATVDASGKVVGVAAGIVTITASSGNLSSSRLISIYVPVASKLVV